MKKLTKTVISLVLALGIFMSMLVPAAYADGNYLPRYYGDSGSIADALWAVGVDGSYSYRARIAAANGISDYVGSRQQNIHMLSLLKSGLLISPEAPAPEPSQPAPQPEPEPQPTVSGNNTYFERYTGTSTSIVDALKSLGVDSSFTYRARIANANGISWYFGTSSQNQELLRKLKAGCLKSPDAPANVPQPTPEPEPTQPAPEPTQPSYNYTCSDYSECTRNDANIYVITKNNCAIREYPSNTGKIVARGQKGQLISVKQVICNWKLNKWAQLQMADSDKHLYIYIGNCAPHTHSYVTLLENQVGKIEYCASCGYAKGSTSEQTATCDLTCVADQAIKGSFSQHNPSFAGILAQIAVAELPYVGWVADGRDLVGDIVNSEPWHIIALDMATFLPLVSALKYADDVAIFGKHTDDISKVTKHADDVSAGLKNADRITSVSTKTDSTKLAKNMRKAFEETGKERFYDFSDYIFDGKRNVAAHHIVAGGANNKHARESRALLSYVGIDINDSANGVFLISNSKHIDEGALHAGRHSDTYFKEVRDRLFTAVEKVHIPSYADNDTIVATYRQAVERELGNIAEDLISGDLLLN